MAAAAKARELMDRYQIDEGMAALTAEGTIRVDVSRSPYRGLMIRDRIAMRIAEFCDCRCWKNNCLGKVYFFGMPADVEFASWLIESLDTYVRNASLQFAKANCADPRNRWAVQKSFIIGAVDRINGRLLALIQARKAQTIASTGKSLVVVKGAIVTEAFAKLNLGLRRGGRFQTSINDRGAFAAGQAAGDRASFGRPVGNGAMLRLK